MKPSRKQRGRGGRALLRPHHTCLRVGNLEFRDPLPACMVLYLLFYFDASGFLRIGLLAACLHECGHILVYARMLRRRPVIEVTMTGFCLKTRGLLLPARQAFVLAAAGPAVNLLLAAVWWARLQRQVALWDDAFFAANVLTAAFNLLPIPPLDGAQILAQGREIGREISRERRAETDAAE